MLFSRKNYPRVGKSLEEFILNLRQMLAFFFQKRSRGVESEEEKEYFIKYQIFYANVSQVDLHFKI